MKPYQPALPPSAEATDMHPTSRTNNRCTARRATALALTLAACWLPATAGVPIGNNPLYLVSGKANLLVILDNSNSMDEDASGAAVGSNSPNSKSEIARGVVRNLTTTYKNRVNLGLMSYKQNSPSDNFLHNSPYDASYDPATYDPSWTGARDSATHKRFRMPNVSSPGEYVYYNVALPFYAGSSQGNRFCYSTTANAFNNGENPASGPWDTYRCFPTKTGVSNTLPTWGNATSEAAQGYSGGANSYTFHPTDSDFAQGILDFGKMMSWNVVSRTWLRNDSPGRGYLEVPIKPLDTTQGTKIKDKLACNIPGTPTPCTSSGIKNAGLTPLEGTLYTAKDYFKGGGGSWTDTSEGYTASCYPLPNSCGKDFVILLTDGLPSTDKNGALVAVPSTAIAQTAAAAAALKAAGIETYVIGFALPFGTDPTTLDAIAAAGGTGTAYSADNTASLEAAFKSIFDDVFRKTSAFGAVSQNSTAINDGSRVYQGRFDSTDWSGELEALKPKQDGTMVSQWSTNDAGRFAAPSARKVFTYKPGSGGVAFKVLTDLDATQQGLLATGSCGGALGTGAACAQARIDWMRGDTTNEEATGPLRKRTRVLGDIISSSPYYVSDTRTLYVGANDGMLHAFDADTGNELFAYVPNALMDRLERAVSQLEAFNADVAHELRTPLAALQAQWDTAQLEAARAGHAPTPAQAKVGEGLARLSRLVTQMLALARLEHLDAPAQRAAIDWSTLVEQLFGELLPLAETRQAELECQWPPRGEPPLLVHGDSALLTLMLRNLLDNALRHSPPRGRRCRKRSRSCSRRPATAHTPPDWRSANVRCRRDGRHTRRSRRECRGRPARRER